MKNFEEKMILRAKNLKGKITLPKRWIYKIAKAYDKGMMVPLFEERANNYAIEAACAEMRLQKTKRRKADCQYDS